MGTLEVQESLAEVHSMTYFWDGARTSTPGGELRRGS